MSFLSFLCTMMIAGGVALPVEPASADPLEIIATTPGLADVIRQIGGDEVDVKLLTPGAVDPHKVMPKASMLLKLKRADALVSMVWVLSTRICQPFSKRSVGQIWAAALRMSRQGAVIIWWVVISSANRLRCRLSSAAALGLMYTH